MAEPVHDFSLAYAERDLGEVAAGFTQRPTADGGVVVEGHCPACRGRTVTEFPRGVPGSGTKGVLSRLRQRITGAGPEPHTEPDILGVLGFEVLFCECSHVHPRQPVGTAFVGCGAQWRVRADGGGS
ncbi:hypothetical protein [Streptomyces sp. UNOC14_S4]|uniref:hypothetical protein n=1 Tax=Streptomyces sp. UNOC14_S4 TaxID=2872340 RepID=UPI001E39C7EF|nr:hypothetical protein [Streptomyces sp. UNOC14_S4]MCC3767613.1 hypothetical protein [Streptomyces sp. UNOC14_S4]